VQGSVIVTHNDEGSAHTERGVCMVRRVKAVWWRWGMRTDCDGRRWAEGWEMQLRAVLS
jgi:hypothetical protein